MSVLKLLNVLPFDRFETACTPLSANEYRGQVSLETVILRRRESTR